MSPLQNDRDREVYREGAKGRGGQEEQDLKHKLMLFECSKRERKKTYDGAGARQLTRQMAQMNHHQT